MARRPQIRIPTFRRLQAFPWASDQQIEELSQHITLPPVPWQTLIFSEGVDSDAVYVLFSGVIKLSVRGFDGDYVLVNLIRPGELFGITSLLPKVQRAFRSEAFTDCWVGSVLPKTIVETLPGVSFERFSAFMEITASLWFELLQRYAQFQALNVHQKLAQKFGVGDARGTIISLPLTHDGLAELVGASRPRVTEALRTLQHRDCLLRVSRKFIVRQEKLQQLLRTDENT